MGNWEGAGAISPQRAHSTNSGQAPRTLRQALRPFVKLRTGELRRASGQAQRVGSYGERGIKGERFLETQLQRTQAQGDRIRRLRL